GGKLTTYRRLAEEAADMLAPRLGARRGAWTAGVPLPGGDLAGWLGRPPGRPDEDFEDFVRALARQHPEASPAVVRRLARAYGTAAVELLAQPLGGPVAPGVHEAELEHLRTREWALDGDDVLWRRSKLGLHLAPADAQAVRRWMERRARPAQVPDTLPG
ncbi:MAG: glycerol-3-phosphate dehydrogenase, partial [Rhodoferax sp.]|nr:glycerol-3-phosphate dehydrogenase [Rhodoferax sp.]